MSKNIILKAEKRELLGRKVKKIRKEGKLPAVMFSSGQESLPVTVNTKDFQQVFKEAGETNLITLAVGSENYPVLVQSLQKHPLSDQLLHIDFHKVNLKEKVTANVPVEVVGESPAEKLGLGTIVVYVDEVEVECLPGDIPDKFEVNVSDMSEVGNMKQVKDLNYDKSKVEIKDELDNIVVKVDPLAKEEEVAHAPVEGEAVTEEAQTQTPEKTPDKENKE